MPAQVACMAGQNDPASGMTQRVQRVAIMGSPDKPLARETLDRAVRWVQTHATVVHSDISYDSQPALATRPDLLIVLGGDGTLIAAVHGLREQQLPIVGVNLGKLGYLADFTIDDLEREGEFLFSGQLPITRRAMIDVCVERNGTRTCHSPAVNDCVILAGRPFHMIQMTVAVDGDEVASVRGDGLIIATPSGSTAHNLAAGGPILEPTGEALILTPICPQALTFRPVVMDARRRLVVTLVQANAETTVVVDGRVLTDGRGGDRIVVTRYGADFLLVRNPHNSEWHALRRKLRWGEGPNMH